VEITNVAVGVIGPFLRELEIKKDLQNIMSGRIPVEMLKHPVFEEILGVFSM
jgi:hypothetical protein